MSTNNEKRKRINYIRGGVFQSLELTELLLPCFLYITFNSKKICEKNSRKELLLVDGIPLGRFFSAVFLSRNRTTK